MIHYAVLFLVDFFLGIYSLTKSRNASSIALALTAFSLGLWSLELYLLSVMDDVALLSLFFHLTRWGMFFIPSSIALLAWRVIGARSQVHFWSVVLPGLAMSLALGVTNVFFAPTKLIAASGGYLPERDSILSAFNVVFAWCLLGSILFCSLALRSGTVRERQRVRWLLIILAASMVVGILSLWLLRYDFYLKLSGALGNIVFLSLLFYATVQHHLMDVRFALGVGLVRLLLLGLTVWLYFFINAAVVELDQGNTGRLVMLFFIVAALELYPRALRWMLPNAKRLISRYSYDFEQISDSARNELSLCINVRGVNRVLEYLFVHVMRIAHYQLWVVNSEDDEVGAKKITLKASYKNKGANEGDGLSDAERNTFLEYCRFHRGLIVVDETPERIQKIAEALEVNAFFIVEYGNELSAVVLIGNTMDMSFYRFDDICLFEWLAKELGQVFNRIHQLDKMQDELGDAKKTLSMLGVMNHYHHDIKAPLAIIDGVLSNDIYDKEKQRAIVLEQVDRSSRLIATMAQILRGQRKRKVSAVSLKEIIKDSLFVLSQSESQVNTHFADLPRINGDAEDLKILVINLVKNAMEARKPTTPLTLTIRTWDADDAICLSITDNGVGIPEERLQMLWDEYTTTKPTGSGIGLQAIKRIADEHHASVDVVSRVNEGTSFTLKFPKSLAIAEPFAVNEEGVLHDSLDKAQNKNIVPLWNSGS